jgi:hypothetical protein
MLLWPLVGPVGEGGDRSFRHPSVRGDCCSRRPRTRGRGLGRPPGPIFPPDRPVGRRPRRLHNSEQAGWIGRGGAPRKRKRPPRWEHAVACGSSLGVEMIFGNSWLPRIEGRGPQSTVASPARLPDPLWGSLCMLYLIIYTARTWDKFGGRNFLTFFARSGGSAGRLTAPISRRWKANISAKTAPPSRHRPRSRRGHISLPSAWPTAGHQHGPELGLRHTSDLRVADGRGRSRVGGERRPGVREARVMAGCGHGR